MEEFKNGQWEEQGEPPLFVTQTQVHKTSATEGAATLFWHKRNYKLGQISFKRLRPLVLSGGKFKFAPVPGVAKDREGFFLNHSGQVMTCRLVTRRVTELVKKAFPNENLSFHVSRLRKHIVTSHRRRENPSVLAVDLMRQMSHNVKTAERHYHVKDEIRQKAHVGNYLEEATKESEKPSTFQEHAPSSSSDAGTLMERFGKRKSQEAKTLASRKVPQKTKVECRSKKTFTAKGKRSYKKSYLGIKSNCGKDRRG